MSWVARERRLEQTADLAPVSLTLLPNDRGGVRCRGVARDGSRSTRDSRSYILHMPKTCLTLVIATFVVTSPGAARAQSTVDEKAVIAIADSALDAITRGDAVALTDLMIPEGVLYPTSTREGVTTYRMRTREAQRASAIRGVVERGFSPRAMVSGGVAMVWMPYDLYVNGAWSHCGADVFTLVKSGGVWRIAAMAWSAEQPPVCERHPAGPPDRR